MANDMTEGMELPNQDKFRTLAENKTYKYLSILEADTMNKWKWKTKFKKNISGELKKLLETKLSSRNLIEEINTCAVLRVRYLGLFLKGTSDELKQMDQRTKKLMPMHKALHLRDDVDRL